MLFLDKCYLSSNENTSDPSLGPDLYECHQTIIVVCLDGSAAQANTSKHDIDIVLQGVIQFISLHLSIVLLKVSNMQLSIECK